MPRALTENKKMANHGEIRTRELKEGWTPLGALCRAIGQPYPFLLDGAGGPKRFSRRSFAGISPFIAIHSRGLKSTIEYLREGRVEEVQSHPFEILRSLLAKYSLAGGQLPPMTGGGMVGYLSYDLFPLIEKVGKTASDDLSMPDMFFCLYDAVVHFDNESGKAHLSHRQGAPEEVLQFWLSEPPEPPSPSLNFIDVALADLSPNQSREKFMGAVEKAREYIKAGDVYQVNLSQRFCLDYDVDPVDFYARLRSVSPAPFGACLFPQGFSIMSNSPERYLLIDGDYIETRPIKGTRPRGRTPEEDAALAAELKASVKDNAEHVMIVDLERNDLGRVCNYNTVHVPELAIVESYANVHHLVSTVAGRVHPSMDIVSCIKNSFPGGSITGAPKVRALEIIDELEPTARGVYCGSIGYIDFCGKVDLNIAIRTAVKKGGKLYFQVGGGIVHDSVPAEEYDETITKAQSFLKALSGKGRVWSQK